MRGMRAFLPSTEASNGKCLKITLKVRFYLLLEKNARCMVVGNVEKSRIPRMLKIFLADRLG
jgi:hypothetical protein